MKICIISYIYPTRENKTFGLFVHHQAKELVKNNEVHVITKHNKDMPSFEIIDGIKVHRIGILNYNLELLSKLISLHNKVNFDILHSHFVGFSTLLCGIAARALRVAYVITLHGSEILSLTFLSYSSLKNIMKRIYLSFPQKIMCVSKYTAELAKKIVDKNKIVIVHNGVDPQRLKPNKSGSLFKKQIKLENNKIILSIGDLVKRKGHDTVIKVVSLLKKSFPNLTYILIGNGPEKQNLVNLSKKLRVEKYVRFIDYTTDKELSNYYNLCDMFVLMSRTVPEENGVEGFGVVFIEASMLGKPVIAGASGGTSDAVIDGITGFLVEPDNLDELCKKITLLLKNSKLRTKLGVNGRNFVMSNLLWEHNVAKTIEVYKEAINQTNRKFYKRNSHT